MKTKAGFFLIKVNIKRILSEINIRRAKMINCSIIQIDENSNFHLTAYSPLI